MIIDVLSDLHFDYYFKEEITEEKVKELFSHIFLDNGHRKAGDTLLIAGDIGHYNQDNITILKLIKKIYGYRYILCVLGNHDYYLFGEEAVKKYQSDSSNRVIEMRDLINKEEGMHCLDGEIVEIEGIKFGGCDGWYDGEYIHEHFGERSTSPNYLINEKWIEEHWFESMNDGDYLYEFNWREKATLEKEKIEKIYKEADVMLTHINPSLRKNHSNIRFRDEESTGFFTFNGEPYILDSNIKYWVFGHTHEEIEFELHGTTCICNPMGRPSENMYGQYVDIKSFEM